MYFEKGLRLRRAQQQWNLFFSKAFIHCQPKIYKNASFHKNVLTFDIVSLYFGIKKVIFLTLRGQRIHVLVVKETVAQLSQSSLSKIYIDNIELFTAT